MTISARGPQQIGDTIVKLAALRSIHSKISIALIASISLLLGSCGGGGAATDPLSTGQLQILPATGTIYAGVPYTINIAGGRKPYLIVSDQFTLLPVNFTLNGNTFQMIANNPGVIDIGQQPGQLPTRTVNMQVRDSANSSVTAKYDVAQNFFTGYGQSYTNTCKAGTQACSGQDSIVNLTPVSQGTLYGNRTVRFDKIRGDYHWVQEPPGAAPQIVDSITLNTDHDGRAILRLRVNVNAPTQLATYRITDVATQTSIDVVFIITQVDPIDAITLLPDTVTFTGGPSTQCGSGQATVYVFGGAPPYTVTTTSPVIAFPQVVQNSGDSFVVGIPQNLTNCPQSPQVFVTDTRGRVAVLTVTTGPGTTIAPDITVVPNPIPALTCALNSVSAGIVGGNGPLSAISSHPRVSAIISGNIITVTRAPSGDGAVVYPASAAITITDGTKLYQLNITAVSPNCP